MFETFFDYLMAISIKADVKSRSSSTGFLNKCKLHSVSPNPFTSLSPTFGLVNVLAAKLNSGVSTVLDHIFNLAIPMLKANFQCNSIKSWYQCNSIEAIAQW